MNKLSSIAFTSLLVTVAACGAVEDPKTEGGDDVGENGWMDQGELPPTVIIAKSCANMRAQDPRAEDGDYTLYVGGDETKPWNAYCQDMAGTPLDYLVLAHILADSNFSQYTMGGASTGFDVRTSYSHLRIDPERLVVDTSDQRFTLSTGTLNHANGGHMVTSMPFGVAMACGGSTTVGLANIDLRDTSFALEDSFTFVGSGSFGSALIDADYKTAELSGGGFCGWFAPVNTAFDPMNTAGGSLQLKYAP